jgi:glutathione S-transferase
MKLIGQYDSPFVRRVAVALRLYGMVYEHLPWSTFGAAEQIAAFNPLRRVPTLVLDDGTVLVDSAAILDALDEMAGPDKAMVARTGVERREALRVAAFAAGVADKAVSLLYERVLREQTHEFWVERCRSQVAETLDLLERERAGRATPWWFGDTINHADIMVGAMLTFVREGVPGVFDMESWPALAAHSVRCEALDAFKATHQPYKLVEPA